MSRSKLLETFGTIFATGALLAGSLVVMSPAYAADTVVTEKLAAGWSFALPA